MSDSIIKKVYRDKKNKGKRIQFNHQSKSKNPARQDPFDPADIATTSKKEINFSRDKKLARVSKTFQKMILDQIHKMGKSKRTMRKNTGENHTKGS